MVLTDASDMRFLQRFQDEACFERTGGLVNEKDAPERLRPRR